MNINSTEGELRGRSESMGSNVACVFSNILENPETPSATIKHTFKFDSIDSITEPDPQKVAAVIHLTFRNRLIRWELCTSFWQLHLFLTTQFEEESRSWWFSSFEKTRLLLSDSDILYSLYLININDEKLLCSILLPPSWLFSSVARNSSSFPKNDDKDKMSERDFFKPFPFQFSGIFWHILMFYTCRIHVPNDSQAYTSHWWRWKNTFSWIILKEFFEDKANLASSSHWAYHKVFHSNLPVSKIKCL